MNIKFLNWYTQAIGSTIGIIICTYSYLNGSLYSFGNIANNLNNINLSSAMASYLLLPFCVLSLLFCILKNFDFYYESSFLEALNTFIVIFTLVVGFIGTYFLFSIPSIFFIFSTYLTYKIDNEEDEDIEISLNENF